MDWMNLLLILGLVVLFYAVGKSADVVVKNIRKIAEQIGIPVFFLGLVLGMLTSLPELTIGINALANDLESLSLGNLLGGIIVLFCFVLGFSAVLNRRIATDGKLESFLPVAIYLFLPFPMALDGKIEMAEGIVLMLLYLVLLYVMYLRRKTPNHHVITIKKSVIFKETFTLLVALVAVVVLSNLIVRATLHLLRDWNLSPFIIGLVVFSLGTNLPEIIVSLRSWQRNLPSLSLSNLIGSAIANPFLIGVFATFKTLPATVDASYIFLTVFTFAMLAVLIEFYQSGRALSRPEGATLLALYAAFLLGQIGLYVLG